MKSKEGIEVEKIVSIRCRRHKKRFEVKESWVDVCSWLCPKCYEKLTEEERKAYAPKGGGQPEVREVNPNKGNPEGGKPQEPVIFPKEPKFPVVNSSKSLLDSLRPKHKIHCRKCGQDFPCHASWFLQSKVLCPECYFKMTSEEIVAFHAGIDRNGRPLQTPSIKDKSTHREQNRFRKKFGESDWISTSTRASEAWIREASKDDLIKAVARGNLSRIRAKIELKRRRRESYYNEFAENIGVRLERW